MNANTENDVRTYWIDSTKSRRRPRPGQTFHVIVGTDDYGNAQRAEVEVVSAEAHGYNGWNIEARRV